MNKYHKLPRLFLDLSLEIGVEIDIDAYQNHYISNVLRLKPTQCLKTFNGSDGEFLAEISAQSKKATSIKITKSIRPQKNELGPTIAFSLIKKQRQDFLIEKCTELGVRNFQPILTDHCEVRKINQEKVKIQSIEASEQCERLTVPIIHNLLKLDSFLETQINPIYYCIEREDAPFIHQILDKTRGSDTFLIDPEGGFSEKEKALLEKKQNAVGLNLGFNILRAETAAITCAAAWLFKSQT